jgi:hypothetical protein
MSKQSKIELIKEVITGIHKPKPYMKIFVQASPTDEQVFYTKVPWHQSIDVNCCDEAGAKSLEAFLSNDLTLDQRQCLHDLLEKGGVE